MLRSLGVLLAEGLDVAVVDLPAGDDPDTLVRREGVEGWGKVRDAAYDAVEFVQRHVLRRGGGGDPRERALQVLVRLFGGVQDTIRERLLVERASQVFALPEAVIAQAVRHSRSAPARERPGSAPGPAPAAPVRQRRPDDALEKKVLQALLRAPGALESAREALTPSAFAEGAARQLAETMWDGGDALAAEDDGAALARELLATETEGFDWDAEAIGAVRMLRVRGLDRERRENRSRLASARGEEADRLMMEIDRISKLILELKQ
jgi:DNA primase